MSTGDINLDILLYSLKSGVSGNQYGAEAVASVKRRYPSLSNKEVEEICRLLVAASTDTGTVGAELVVTAPPSFSIKAKSTLNTVSLMLNSARKSITITGYSLSEYFNDMLDCIIRKSQTGVLVKFFLNDFENQNNIDKLLRYKGKFLQIYNYKNKNDSMSALHAKVICVDSAKTLITSANLSYHGQEGNIELGTLIDSVPFAKQVEDLFTRLLFIHVFEALL